MDSQHSVELLERLDRIEKILAGEKPKATKIEKNAIWVTQAVASVLLPLTLGYPNHYNQGLFSLFFLAILYHQGILLRPKQTYEYGWVVLNFWILCCVSKVFLGGGVWTFSPLSESLANAAASTWWASWLAAAVNLKMEVPVSKYQLVTVVFLWVFQLLGWKSLASVFVFLLIFFSTPTLLSLDWNYVLYAVVATAVAFYLQLRR